MNQPHQIEMIPGFLEDDAPIFVTDFDDDSAIEFCSALFRASNKNPTKPIIVYINSPGGEIAALMTMLSAMDSISNEVITVAMGSAMSCGAVLLSHGAYRFASPHSNILIHKISAGNSGHIEDIETLGFELSRLNKYVMKVLADNMSKTVVELDKLMGGKRDLYLTPQEALAAGLVDGIGVPFVDLAPPKPPIYNIGVTAPKNVVQKFMQEVGSLPAKPQPVAKTKKKKTGKL